MVLLVVPGYALIRDGWPILLMTIPIRAIMLMFVCMEGVLPSETFGDRWHVYDQATPRRIRVRSARTGRSQDRR
jgi:hypothetical protein